MIILKRVILEMIHCCQQTKGRHPKNLMVARTIHLFDCRNKIMLIYQIISPIY